MVNREQIMMVGAGLMVAIGFMFMGAVNLAGMAPDAPEGGEGDQEIEAELPENTYQEGSFGLSPIEQAYLSTVNQVVFVNAIYEGNESEAFEDFDEIADRFDGRVYVNVVESEEATQLTSEYQVSDFPEVIVVGDQPTEQMPYTVTDAQPDQESVTEAVCGSMAEVGDAAAVCFG